MAQMKEPVVQRRRIQLKHVWLESIPQQTKISMQGKSRRGEYTHSASPHPLPSNSHFLSYEYTYDLQIVSAMSSSSMKYKLRRNYSYFRTLKNDCYGTQEMLRNIRSGFETD